MSLASASVRIDALAAAQKAFDASDWSAAEAHCRDALRSEPGDPHALHLLGRVLHQQGQIAMAVALFRKALGRQPDFVPALTSLGAAQVVLCRYDDARTNLERAIALDPQAPRPHRIMGMALREQGYLDDAAAEFRRVIALRPADANGYLQLGAVLHEAGDRAGALQALTHAGTLDPDLADVHVKLGNLLHDKGLIVESTASYRRAVELEPDIPFGHSNFIFSLHYQSTHDRHALRAEAERWAARYAGQEHADAQSHSNTPEPERPLRIGYVSADFKRHPVGYFLKSVLSAHDSAAFQTFCYSNGVRADQLTQELASLAHQWRNIAVAADAEVANAIRADRIDILIDLSGHTGGHRLQMFGRRPAPVQATWLGYFGTTGLRSMDYILVDEDICPAGAEDQFTETPVRLPHSYLCYAAPDDAPAIVPPPSATRGHVTFGCFNRLAKMGPDVIALWSEILRQMPDAHLSLKDAALDDDDVRARVEAAFANHGVSLDRIELSGRSSHVEYLAQYGSIDVALDPFPFNGATTTCEALWMGVPVVTLSGDRFVSRMGTSLLSTIGLSDVIAKTPEAYVQIAIEMAKDPERLRSLRTRLRHQVATSPLVDGRAFTSHLERAYRSMWRTWCASQPGSAEV